MATRRTRARETALQMLYQHELNPDLAGDVVREQVLERLEDEALSRFAWSLYMGVLENLASLDSGIEKVAANWSLRRMAHTDRNVLRIGAFELNHTQTPPRVIVDEAIELARKYGSAQSAQFVNGILDRLIPGPHRRSPLPEPVTAAPLAAKSSADKSSAAESSSAAFAEVGSVTIRTSSAVQGAIAPAVDEPSTEPAATHSASTESAATSSAASEPPATETAAVNSPVATSPAAETPVPPPPPIAAASEAPSPVEPVAVTAATVVGPSVGFAEGEPSSSFESPPREFEPGPESSAESGAAGAAAFEPGVVDPPSGESNDAASLRSETPSSVAPQAGDKAADPRITEPEGASEAESVGEDQPPPPALPAGG